MSTGHRPSEPRNLHADWQTQGVLKSLGQVPFGVWCGAVIIVAAAWMQDGWGFVLGILIIGFTTFTSIYAQNRPQEPTGDPEDDGWGATPGSDDERD